MARFSVPVTQLVNNDASGIAAGWLMNFYLTGTTTRKDTFSDSALSSANANPVVADSAGRFGDIFLESGTYRVILTDADAVEIWDADPVVGSLGSSGAFTSNKTSAYTVVIDDATKVIPVDTATTGAVTITLPAVATATSGFEITVFKINAGANDVTIDADGSETIGGLANLLLTMQWESVTIRANDNPATDDWTVIARYMPPSKGTDIASATTTDIASADGKYVDITGTTTITGFGTAEIGAERIIQFDGALTLTHNATSLILPGGANITTAAGDRAKMYSLGSGNWICLWYTPADGLSVVTPTTNVLEFVGTAAITAATPMSVLTAGTIAHTFEIGYDYIVQLEAFSLTTDIQSLWMRFSDDGVNLEADAADYEWAAQATGAHITSTGDTKIVVSASAMGNDAGNFSSIEVTLINPAGTSENTTARWIGHYKDTGATPAIFSVRGAAVFLQGIVAVTGLGFLFSGGSTFKEQGDITVWRRKRS